MKMRTRIVILTGALLLVSAASVRAQQTATDVTPFTPKFGQIDFGYRGNDITGDAARFQRYRDLRDGGYVDQFKFKKDSDTWLFNAGATNVGYRDQSYRAQFENFGKLKASFNWTQVPLWISDSTATLYKDTGNGVLTINDAVQTAIQATGTNTAARDAALTTALTGAVPYDLKSRRDLGVVNLTYAANRVTDIKFNLRNSARTGYNLMSFGFGTSPGLLPAVEFNVPMDDRTTDLKGTVEFANDKGLLAFTYGASWFENNRPTVTFDNPMRATDISAGASKGLTPLWPSNQMFSYNVTGGYRLPGHSRATASIYFAQTDQNSDLVAPTVNTALFATMPALERTTTEGKADTLGMVYAFSSRPSPFVSFEARYRYYDYSNKTVPFETTPLIGDWSLGTGLIENEPASIKRETLDLDGTLSPIRYMDVRFGYTREDADRTFRIFEKTAEDSYRVMIDSVGNPYVTLRTKYEHAVREGSHFDEELLDEVGEQPETRHYDVANRTRDRVSAIVSVTPVSYLELNASVGTGNDKYKDTGFGLLENDTRNWSIGGNVVPNEKVNLGLEYGYEKVTSQQYSRTANPPSATDVTFYDPTRDWWLDQGDKVKTITASADFLKCVRKTDIRLNYILSDGNTDYVYSMKPEQKVFTAVPLTQLAPLKNWLTDVRADVMYYVRPNLALGGVYAYEEYRVEDFSLNTNVLNALNPVNASTGVFASTVYSGYVYRPYKAHVAWVRMTYLW
jgi:MtrB/PioB family decaheme-associated outer membrane protein